MRVRISLCCVIALGCGTSPTTLDAGSSQPDASGADAGADAGALQDAGTSDAGSAADAGRTHRTVGDEYFVEDASDSAANFGFDGPLSYDASARGDEISVTSSASDGPAGRPFIRQVIDDTSLSEFGAGWFLGSFSPAPEYSDSLFVRFSFRVVDDYDQTQKLFIWSPGGENPGDGRQIIVVQPWESGYVYRAAEDGGLWCQTDGGSWTGDGWQGGTGYHTLGNWDNVQMEIRFSSAAEARDGSIKLWRNNDDYASPSCAATNVIVRPAVSSDNFIGWAGYHQGNVASSLPRTFDHTDLRIGPTFDPSWHRSGS
jgi:hypothetical protein